MRYTALVGIKGNDSLKSKPKAEREKYQIELMHTQLKRWNSTETVPEYWDPWYRVDEVYSGILQKGIVLGADINIDDPEAVMNFIGRKTGHRFYKTIPEADRKARAAKLKEYKDEEAQYKSKKKKVPTELKEKINKLVNDPKVAEKTKLYAYCIANPDGMFYAYNFPIKHSYNDIDINSSRLVNRNYGTYHDILKMGDLDFEATLLPSVVFRSDGEVFESDDPEEIQRFLAEEMEADDYIALIECEA